MMGTSTIFRIKGWLSAVVVVAILWSPTVAHACAVCSTGKEDENRTAYIIGTAFMTLMPFVLVGSLLWWLRGFVRESEAAHDNARKLGVEAEATEEMSCTDYRSTSPSNPAHRGSDTRSPLLADQPPRHH